MDEIIFKPKYVYNYYLMFFVLLAFEVLFLYTIIDEGESFIYSLSSIFFGFIIFTSPFVFIRQIRFIDDGLIVKFYSLTIKTIEYDEILDIGLSAINTSRGKLSLRGMRNGLELQEIFSDLIDQGKIDRENLAGTIIVGEQITTKTLPIASAITFAIWIIMYFMDIPRLGGLLRQLLFVVILIPVFLIVYRIIKNRTT